MRECTRSLVGSEARTRGPALQGESGRFPEFAAGAVGGEDVGGGDSSDNTCGDVAGGAEVGGVEVEDDKSGGEAVG